jgi:hypothetical protein
MTSRNKLPPSDTILSTPAPRHLDSLPKSGGAFSELVSIPGMAQPLLAPLGASPAMTLSPASPLFALQTLLNSQTPQLQHLHQLLELPAEHLAVDLGRLHDAFRREFEDLMRQRANEVASWEQRIDIVRHGQFLPCSSPSRQRLDTDINISWSSQNARPSLERWERRSTWSRTARATRYVPLLPSARQPTCC